MAKDLRDIKALLHKKGLNWLRQIIKSCSHNQKIIKFDLKLRKQTLIKTIRKIK